MRFVNRILAGVLILPALTLTPAVAQESATVRDENRIRSGASSSRGALSAVWIVGAPQAAASQRAAFAAAACGWKKKWSASNCRLRHHTAAIILGRASASRRQGPAGG